ncbi:MAG: ESX-1 secretion-associated protein [Mycobacterium sp.]|uniref:type VII secretion target n=1 Tax=uncultured Mycolicibacterium sp. TaxID=2320817 RepID=UPI0032B2815D|nr:ESX-1 secretion-associated protein [Mycobacterium sp.]
MHARLTADTDLIRTYGSASAGHAADLQALAARLATVGTDAALFGPVGAAFLARLNRAVARETDTLAGVCASLSGTHRAAHQAAADYRRADGDAGARLLGGW